MKGNNFKMSYTGMFWIPHFTLSKNFWSSADIINLINYFCCNLYCIFLLLCYAHYLILETVVLTFVYCIVLCRLFRLCVMFSLSLSLSVSLSFCLWQVSCLTVIWQNFWTNEMICMYVFIHAFIHLPLT
jgi:hypothetical protein